MVEPENIDDFNQKNVPTCTVVDIIEKYGKPYYVKIDIEGYDHKILRHLLESGFKPPYISVESHSFEIIAILVALGGYNSFQLVEGSEVAKTYKDIDIETMSGIQRYSFSNHSAGPFGHDLSGDWLCADDFLIELAKQGLGWRDIHASTVIKPKPPRIRLPVNATLRMKLGRTRRELIQKFINKS